LDSLQMYRDSLGDHLEYVRGNRDQKRPLPYFVEAMFSHSITLIEAERQWIEEFLKQLEEIDDQD